MLFTALFIVAVAHFTGPQVEGVSITTINGKILCNDLECPENADTCTVKSDTNENRSQVITLVKCLEKGEKVAEKTTTAPNPGGAHVCSFSKSSIGGSSSSFQSSGGSIGNSFMSSSSSIGDGGNIEAISFDSSNDSFGQKPWFHKFPNMFGNDFFQFPSLF